MIIGSDPCGRPGMKLSDKIKTALEETRILILGAQILLGFQFRGVFSEGYERLPEHSRHLDAIALGLMICAVGLLIAPDPYHRLVEKGEASGELHHFITVVADMALLPFGLALGVDVFLAASGCRTVPEPPLQVPRPPCWRLGFGMAFPACDDDMSARENA
jgi:Family of unknown function (DUF6328)